MNASSNHKESQIICILLTHSLFSAFMVMGVSYPTFISVL